MSIIRVSVLGDEAFEPDSDGALVVRAGQRANSLGHFPVGTRFEQRPSFREYLEKSVAAKAADLGDSPVVIMVHGFCYDPADPIARDRPHQSDNPHDLIYHFSTETPKHWRHSSSWPLGLGFAENDRGKHGLSIAFAWDSKPDILKMGDGGDAARLAAISEMSLVEVVATAGKLVDVATKMKVPNRILSLGDDIVALVRKPPRESLARLLGRIGAALSDLDEAYVRPLVDAIAPAMPSFYKLAYERAEQVAWALASTIRGVANAKPIPRDRPIDIFCHSLGSRVVIQALEQMTRHDREGLRRIGRVIIIGGAEYGGQARSMLAAVGKDGPACYNFMGRRDRVLTHLAGKYHPVIAERMSRPIGYYGLEAKGIEPRWIDLQLDTRYDANNKQVHALNDWLQRRGMPEVASSPEDLKAPKQVASTHPVGILNHWYYFTNPGNMALFKAILRDRDPWEIGRLRRENIPENEPGGELTGDAKR